MVDVKKNESIFIDIVTEFLKQYGYKKNGKTWRMEKDGIIFLFNLQKSQWGAQIYINVGIFFQELGRGNIKIPKYDEWHFTHRFERILDLPQQGYLKLFSLDIEEKELLNNIREICQSIKNKVFPLLEKLSDYKYLANRNIKLEGFWLQKIKREELRIFALNKLKEKGGGK